MLNNPQASYVQRGEAIDYTNTGVTNIKANDVVRLATRIGVAGCDVPVGAKGSIHVVGVYDLPALNTEVFAVGQAAYWNGTAITVTAGTNTPAGWVVEAKATAGTVARIKIG
ncbi:DUF2190 family protein [Clostridium sp. CX1]|uniref:DUF2190 family protein n=1 Tax=Clostridium sp. CX1 TaxID=2978346 RepID=UPI0021C0D8CD|nr:DUF2190 family protein [Clostridium sp. CX1]MCT8975501.1 DUF2190 family protein [Clostridium sp. CX1]